MSSRHQISQAKEGPKTAKLEKKPLRSRHTLRKVYVAWNLQLTKSSDKVNSISRDGDPLLEREDWQQRLSG